MRKVVKKLINGITTADEPVKCAHRRTKNKYGEDTIKESLQRVVSQVDIDMLTLFMQELELYEAQREECVRKMLQLCDESYSQELEPLTTIPGIKTQSAMTILSELANDWSSFKTSSHLVGREGLRARNEESAGKIKSRQTMHGNKLLRVILVQCAWANMRSKTSKPGRK
jgi:transposase